MKVLIATNNDGKMREFRALLEPFGHCGRSITEVAAELGRVPPPIVDETAVDYRGNAELKARALTEWSGMPTLADDTGLEVEALGGAPGVDTANFAGPGASGAANVQKLLLSLSGVANRRARFVCVLCFVYGDHIQFSEGVIEGAITQAPRGDHGFGYDPIFEIDDTGLTLAESKFREKVETHRTRALQKLFSQKILT